MPMRGMGGARQHYVEYDFKENVLEVLPFYAMESCVTFRHVKMFVTHYLADYIGESEEIYEM